MMKISESNIETITELLDTEIDEEIRYYDETLSNEAIEYLLKLLYARKEIASQKKGRNIIEALLINDENENIDEKIKRFTPLLNK